MDTTDYLPGSKYDIEAVKRARVLGFPALNDRLLQMLEWLQDVNWPVAAEIKGLLATAGVEIVPHIKAIFASDDHVWKRCLISSGLIEDLAPLVKEALRDDLVRFAANPSEGERDEEVNQLAEEILAAWGTQ